MTLFNDYFIPNSSDLLDPPSIKDYPNTNVKYCSLDKYNELGLSNDYVDYVIKNCPLQDGFRHTLIDVKTHDLELDEYPCLPGWHIDCRTNYIPRNREIYHIFVSSDVSLTEFSLSVINSEAMFHKEIPKFYDLEHSTAQIKPLVWNTYDSYSFHRGSKAQYNGKRLLIRVCQTNENGVHPQLNLKLTKIKGS